MYKSAVEAAPTRWSDVESEFLDAIWKFDDNFVAGLANQGDNQNGKGDWFTDLICLVLENASGKSLFGRGKVPGLFFRNHNLDGSYPQVGPVMVLLETKMAGAPKTSRNPMQKNPEGRAGSSDLDKRLKEAGFKTLDLKAEWARVTKSGSGPAGDLVQWLRASKPLCFFLIGIRIVNDKDLARTIHFARVAGQMMDGVGPRGLFKEKDRHWLSVAECSHRP